MLKTKMKAAAVVAASLAAAVAVPAHAAIDASVGTAFTALQADATELAGIVTPIVVAVMGLAIVIKLIKRFGNKL